MNRRRTTVREVHHGRTKAAWAGSMIALVAFGILTFGFLTGGGQFPSFNMPVILVGGLLLLLAPLVGGVMNRLGHGQD